MSLSDRTDKNEFKPLPMSKSFFYSSTLDDGHDQKLRLELFSGVDIESSYPLHAEVYGERAFSTVAELDVLISDLQDLRAEWLNLTTQGGDRA